MSEWQPIETAPREKPVLVFATDEVFLAELTGVGWEVKWSGSDLHWPMRVNPTHWMPLPEPPK